MDTLCYERQHGADMEVGSYAHRAILHEPEEIPSLDQAKLSPTEMPFTEDDFDPQLEQALELMPELLGAEGAEIRYAINGLLSLTADGSPILGESEVKGLWVSAAVWIKEGPGVGRAVAEWMTHGHSEIDVHHSDIARFYPHENERAHVRARTSEAFIKTYGIIHPGEQYESDRGVRWSPMAESQKALGAVFYETVGWERPWWYESNADLLEKYGDAVMPREHEWDSRWWSPIINAEHLAMRENAGVIDLTAFCDLRHHRPGRPRVGAADLRRAVRRGRGQGDLHPGARRQGRVPLRPHRDAARRGPLPRRHRRRARHGRPAVVHRPPRRRRRARATAPRSSPRSASGVRAPATSSASLTGDDVSDGGFGFLTCREIAVKGVDSPVLASRISYVGELGWELYVPFAQAAQLWDAVLEAGKDHGAVPVGIGVYGTTGRLEKGYRAFGFELDAERTIVEAGMQRPKVKAADFVGREAYLAQRESEPAAVLCTLTVDDHTSASGTKRYMLGGEPILTRDGGTLTDGHGHHPYVTSAGSAPSLGKHVLLAYLPPDQAHDRQRARGVLHGGALPGHRRLGGRDAAARPRQRADPVTH